MSGKKFLTLVAGLSLAATYTHSVVVFEGETCAFDEDLADALLEKQVYDAKGNMVNRWKEGEAKDAVYDFSSSAKDIGRGSLARKSPVAQIMAKKAEAAAAAEKAAAEKVANELQASASKADEPDTDDSISAAKAVGQRTRNAAK